MSFRVALFVETFLPKVDGVAKISALTLEHLRRIEAEALLFTTGERVPSHAEYEVISMPGVPFPLYPELIISIPRHQDYERLVAFDPDVVHVLAPLGMGLWAMRWARQLDKPLLLSFHTHAAELARFYGLGVLKGAIWELQRQIYNRGDYTLAVSERIQAELTAHGIRRVGLWRRGVDTDRFSPTFASAVMRDRLTDDHPGRLLFLTVSRLAKEKQVEHVRHVLEALPEAHLAIVGDGPHRAALERIYRPYPNVTFTGYLHGRDLSAAFASADIFMFPSSPFETFGLVAAEAMASATPIIASNVGGVPELVRQGKNGYMFSPGDTESMVHFARLLANHPQQRQQMGKAARQDMLSRTWTAVMDELFDVYRRLIDGSL